MAEPFAATSRRVFFSFLVAMHVGVEDDLNTFFTSIDDAPVLEPAFVAGGASYLGAAVLAVMLAGFGVP